MQPYTIVHSDDRSNWRELFCRHFPKWGIAVESFATNEEALTSAKTRLDRGEPYQGAILDYNTESNLSGVDAITEMAKGNLCGEVLILSSSMTRNILLQELNDRGIGKQVQVFEKDYERPVIECYVVLRARNPERTRNLTRTDLLNHFGIPHDDNGNVEIENIRQVEDAFDNFLNSARRDMGILDQAIVKINQEGVHRGSKESE